MTEPRKSTALRRLLALLLCAMLAVGLLSVTANADAAPETDVVGRVVLRKAADWNSFAARVNAGETNLNAIMMADIVLPANATLLGTPENPYKGEFDGNGHTLTYNLTANRNRYGLFLEIYSCTIMNLHATGSVTTAYRMTGGLAGNHQQGTSYFRNCRVSVTVNSTVEDDCAHGGFLGCAKTGSVSYENCLFDGSLLGEASTYAAGFTGFGYNSTSIFYCSLFDPAQVTMFVWKAFARGESSVNITDSYFTYYYDNTMSWQGSDGRSKTVEQLVESLGPNWAAEDGHARPILVIKSLPAELSYDSFGRVVINNASDWDAFAWRVNHGERTLSAVLGCDVTLDRSAEQVGNGSYYYSGSFSGNGHTLTVDYASKVKNSLAPFAYVGSASISDLRVTGSVSSTKSYTAGLAGSVYNTTNIDRVWVSVDITNASSNSKGGIVGYVSSNSVHLSNCLYDGNLNVRGYAGGFVGYSSYTSVINNSLMNPASFTTGGNYSIFTFVNGNKNLTNCWYTNPLLSAQGEDASALSAAVLKENLGEQWKIEDGAVVPVMKSSELMNTVPTDEQGRLILSTAEDWEAFAFRVNHGENELNAVMANDITLNSTSYMAGSSNNYYQGFFDGCGHTLTVNYSTYESYAAPFSYICNATIQRLKTAGSITTSGTYAGGIVGCADGSANYLVNCESAVAISSTNQGNSGHGGLVGYKYSEFYFYNCAFTGSLLGAATDSCGGFIGYRSGGAQYFYNCLFNPAQVTVSSTNSATFVRNGSPSNSDSSLYTQTFGSAQCSDGSQLSAAELAEALGSAWSVEEDTVTLDIQTVDLSQGSAIIKTYGALVDGAAEPIPATVTFAGCTLTYGTDFTVTYTNNTEPDATATAIVVGTGLYSGSFEAGTFRVVAAEGECGSGLTWIYNENTATLTVTYTKDGETTGAMTSYESNQTPWSFFKYDCTAIVLPEGLTSIGRNAFRDIDKVTGVTVPSTVTTIEDYAFYDADGLTAITLHSGITNIGTNAFYSCNALKDVYLEHTSSTPAVSGNAFQYVTGNLWVKNVEMYNATGKKYGGGTFTMMSTGIKDLSDPRWSVITGVDPACLETGEAIRPVPVVTLFGTELTQGVDYTVSYGQNVSGTGEVTIVGKGAYTGSQTVSFDILSGAIAYLDASGEEQSYDTEGLTFITDGLTLTDGWYLLLSNINNRIEISGDVNIILLDGTTCNVPKGIHVPASSSLTIYAQSALAEQNGALAQQQTCGRLVINNVDRGQAAIGGNSSQVTGAITVIGGILELQGGSGGAAIGSGDNGSCTEITVNGGQIIATGGSEAAAIGTGDAAGSAGVIVINGGWLDLTGGSNYGSGIGTADDAIVGTATFDITVNGGHLNINAPYSAIGAGWRQEISGTITINGGNIYANGGTRGGFGIGSGSANTVINLNWTDPADSIYSTSYGGTVVIADGKSFRYADTGAVVTLPIANSETIVPDATLSLSGPEDCGVPVGGTAEFKVFVLGGYGQASFLWQEFDEECEDWIDLEDEISDTLCIYVESEDQDGTQYRCVVTDSSGTQESEPATLYIVDPILEIADQPVDVEAAEGETAEFSVAVNSNLEVSYQWYVKEQAEGDWIAIANNSNSDTYSLVMLAEYDGYQFKCVITTSADSVETDAVTLSLPEPESDLEIVSQPEDVEVVVGETAVFTVEVESTLDVTYQWYVLKSAEGEWTAVKTGGTNATYSLAAQLKHNGYQYKCHVSDGITTEDTEPVTLTVTEAEPSLEIVSAPEDVVVEEGETAVFEVIAEGKGELSYQWYVQKTPGGSWSVINAASAKTATYTLTAQLRHNGYRYKCLIRDDETEIETEPVLLSVDPAVAELEITAQPVSVTVAEGETAVFSVTAQGGVGPLSYQWYVKKTAQGDWATVKTGGKSDTYTLVVAVKHDGYQYKCVVTDGEETVESAIVTLTVGEEPAGIEFTAQPEDVTVAEGETAVFTVAVDYDGEVSYQWYVKKSAVGEWAAIKSGSTSATYTLVVAAKHDGYQYKCIVTYGDQQTAESDVATLTVGEEPAGIEFTAQPEGVTVAEGETAVFTVAVDYDGEVSYQWYVKKSAVGEWAAIKSGSTSATYTLVVAAKHNGYQYKCIVTYGNQQTAESDVATLTVGEEPAGGLGTEHARSSR